VPAASFPTLSLCLFTTLNRLLRQSSAQPLNPIDQDVRKRRYVQPFERSKSMQAIKKRQIRQNDRVEQLCSRLMLNQSRVCRCEVAHPPVAHPPFRWENGA
jgi:primosomal protein N''